MLWSLQHKVLNGKRFQSDNPKQVMSTDEDDS